MKKIPEITVQNLDHLGLVAGIIHRIQIIEKIEQLVGGQPGEIVSPGHLEIIKNLKWLSRVPLGVKKAKNLISQLTEAEFVDSKIPGYRWSQQHSDYAGIPQRWLLVETAQRRQADLRLVEKEIQKLEQEARQKLKQLSSQKFSCQPDTSPAAIQLSGKLKYDKLTNIYAPSFIGVKKQTNPSTNCKLT